MRRMRLQTQASKLPDHSGLQQIRTVFATADAPLGRGRCARRTADRAGIVVETEQGLFTQARP